MATLAKFLLFIFPPSRDSTYWAHDYAREGKGPWYWAHHPSVVSFKIDMVKDR